MGYLFQCRDPLNRVIVLEHECFEEHIVFEHVHMKRRLGDLKQCLEHPDEIYLDVDDRTRESFYRTFQGAYGDFMIKAVVEFNLAKGFGEVITAFKCDSIKAGEEKKWQQ